MSVKQVRNQLWKIHEAHLRDERTGQTHVLTMNERESADSILIAKTRFTTLIGRSQELNQTKSDN